MSCTHTQQEPAYWYEDECPFTGERHGEWREGEVVSTTEDMDTGRYRCTQCGEVMYYTGRWRDLYEGKTPPTDFERRHMGPTRRTPRSSGSAN
jgi:hypothetical protein